MVIVNGVERSDKEATAMLLGDSRRNVGLTQRGSIIIRTQHVSDCTRRENRKAVSLAVSGIAVPIREAMNRLREIGLCKNEAERDYLCQTFLADIAE